MGNGYQGNGVKTIFHERVIVLNTFEYVCCICYC